MMTGVKKVMKKHILKIVALALGAAQLLLLCACTGGDENNETDKNSERVGVTETGTETVEETTDYLSMLPENPEILFDGEGDDTACLKAGQQYIYGDYIFYYDTDTYTIDYRFISSLDTEAVTVPLNGGESIYNLLFLVDEETSEEYGTPVIIAKYSMTGEDGTYYKIVSIDLASGTESVILDSLTYAYIEYLYLYGDDIFFTSCDEYLDNSRLHHVTTAGDDYAVLEPPEEETGSYFVETVYDGRIYYGIGNNRYRQVYSTTPEFEDTEYVFGANPMNDSNVTVQNGYIIYPKNGSEIYFYADDTEEAVVYTLYYSGDLVCSPLDDTSTVYTLAYGVYSFYCGGDYIFYTRTTPRNATSLLADSGTNVMYAYSQKTGITTEIYNLGDAEYVRYVRTITDKYILFEDWYSIEKSDYILYDIETGEETEIPY